MRVCTEVQVAGRVSQYAQRAGARAHYRLHGLVEAHVYADKGRSSRRGDTRPGSPDPLTPTTQPVDVFFLTRTVLLTAGLPPDIPSTLAWEKRCN